jgi:hypothetical protein
VVKFPELYIHKHNYIGYFYTAVVSVALLAMGCGQINMLCVVAERIQASVGLLRMQIDINIGICVKRYCV